MKRIIVAAKDDLKQQIAKFLERKGYDMDSDDAMNYVWGVAEYIQQARDAGEDYSIEEWYKDTKQNYPEDLRSLPKKVESGCHGKPTKKRVESASHATSTLDDYRDQIERIRHNLETEYRMTDNADKKGWLTEAMKALSTARDKLGNCSSMDEYEE